MTDSEPPRRRSGYLRFLPLIAAGVLVAGAVLVGVRFGAPAVVLWLAFALLSAAVLLFWESVRLLVDPNAPGDEPAQDASGADHTELEQRRKAALRALKDIEFEHNIQRLSDDDYAALREQYRAEARDAMAAMDAGLGGHLQRAEAMISQATGDPVEVAAAASAASMDGVDAPRRAKKGRKGSAAVATAPPAGEASVSAPTEAAPEVPAEKPSVDAPAATESVVDAAPVQPAVVASATTDAGPRVCSQCSTSNDPDAVFCKRCATRLTEAG